MPSERDMLRDIGRAIDAMDTDRVLQGLQALGRDEHPGPDAAEALRFASQIRAMAKEQTPMKSSKKLFRTLLVAAVVAAMCLSVYAAANWQRFSFWQSEDRYLTLRTTEGMTEGEVRAWMDENDLSDGSIPGGGESSVKDFTFASVEEALSTLDMAVPLPAAMPPMDFVHAIGETRNFGDYETRTLWLMYEDASGRCLEITTTRHIYTDSSGGLFYTEHGIDPGSAGAYRSASGVTYDTMTESDPDGKLTADIATLTVGDYDYALVFLGFSESQWQAVVDSVDIAPLR